MQVQRAKLPKQDLANLSQAKRTLFLLLGHVSNEINVLQKLMMMLRREKAPSRVVDIVEAGQVMILLRNLVDDEPWELYLSDTVANSFYYASELVIMKAALDLVAAEPVAGEALDQTKAGDAHAYRCQSYLLPHRSCWGSAVADVRGLRPHDVRYGRQHIEASKALGNRRSHCSLGHAGLGGDIWMAGPQNVEHLRLRVSDPNGASNCANLRHDFGCEPIGVMRRV